MASLTCPFLARFASAVLLLAALGMRPLLGSAHAGQTLVQEGDQYLYTQDFNPPQSGVVERFTTWHYPGGLRDGAMRVQPTTREDFNHVRAYASGDGVFSLLLTILLGTANGTDAAGVPRCLLCDLGFPGVADFRNSTISFDVRQWGCRGMTGKFVIWAQSQVGPFAPGGWNARKLSNWALWTPYTWNAEIDSVPDGTWIRVTRVLTDRDMDDDNGVRWPWAFMDSRTTIPTYGYEALTRVLQYMSGDLIFGYYRHRNSETPIAGCVFDFDNVSFSFRP